MKTCIPIISFWIILTLPSCISYKYIDLQSLNPGSVKLPSNITLHIIDPQKIDSNNLVSFSDINTNKLDQHYLLIHTFDSTLKVKFNESPLFENSKIIIQKESDFQNEIITKTAIEKYRHISILTSIQKLEDTENKIEVEYDTWNYYYVAWHRFIYKLKIELKNIGNEFYYNSSLLSDTLTWSSTSYYKEVLIRNLPTQTEAIREIGVMVAEKYAEKISPFWKTEERMLYYSHNKYLRKGYNQYLANNLEGAILSWKHLYQIGTPQLASAAAHNIALMYELLDDFENSEFWLNNSLQSKIHYQTKYYLTRIKERNAGRKKLDEQMMQQ